MSKEKELVGATTGLLILTVLAKSPNYGYEIVRKINEQADKLFLSQEGTIYPLLHKMEKDKLVRSQWQDTENGRRRKYYYITAKGREELESVTKQWNDFHNLIIKFSEVSDV